MLGEPLDTTFTNSAGRFQFELDGEDFYVVEARALPGKDNAAVEYRWFIPVYLSRGRIDMRLDKINTERVTVTTVTE